MISLRANDYEEVSAMNQLCLSEIPSEAGVGRRIVAARATLRREQRRSARSPRCDLRTKRSPVLSALRIGTPVRGLELRRVQAARRS